MNKTRVPKASPEPLPELVAFLEPFAPLFRRQTSRDSMERYLTGLLTDLPHKTCDTIADVIAGTSVERLQHLLTDAAWDPRAVDEARVKRLLALHPATDGILVFDDTELPKKVGTSSGRYEPIQFTCLYRMNSGISVQMKGRIRVISITEKTASRPGQRSRENP